MKKLKMKTPIQILNSYTTFYKNVDKRFYGWLFIYILLLSINRQISFYSFFLVAISVITGFFIGILGTKKC